MHCSAGTGVHMRVLFPKESPMLGFSFSLVVMDGDGRVDGRGWGCGRKMDAK